MTNVQYSGYNQVSATVCYRLKAFTNIHQGVFSGVLAYAAHHLRCFSSKLTKLDNRMSSFDTRMGDAVSDPGKKGWLVAILELGAWAGVLVTGVQNHFNDLNLQLN